MKKFLLVFFLFTSLQAVDITLNNTPTKLYFSPRGGCQIAIIREIDNSSKEILVQAYSFTSVPISEALVKAQKRGVQVEVILDKGQNFESPAVMPLLDASIKVYSDPAHSIAHNKIMIIDKITIITGSYNFTKAAEERNSENILIIKSEELSQHYLSNFRLHKEHSDLVKIK